MTLAESPRFPLDPHVADTANPLGGKEESLHVSLPDANTHFIDFATSLIDLQNGIADYLIHVAPQHLAVWESICEDHPGTLDGLATALGIGVDTLKTRARHILDLLAPDDSRIRIRSTSAAVLDNRLAIALILDTLVHRTGEDDALVRFVQTYMPSALDSFKNYCSWVTIAELSEELAVELGKDRLRIQADIHTFFSRLPQKPPAGRTFTGKRPIPTYSPACISTIRREILEKYKPKVPAKPKQEIKVQKEQLRPNTQTLDIYTSTRFDGQPYARALSDFIAQQPIRGQSMSISKLAALAGIPLSMLWQRIDALAITLTHLSKAYQHIRLPPVKFQNSTIVLTAREAQCIATDLVFSGLQTPGAIKLATMYTLGNIREFHTWISARDLANQMYPDQAVRVLKIINHIIRMNRADPDFTIGRIWTDDFRKKIYTFAPSTARAVEPQIREYLSGTKSVTIEQRSGKSENRLYPGTQIPMTAIKSVFFGIRNRAHGQHIDSKQYAADIRDGLASKGYTVNHKQAQALYDSMFYSIE